MIHLQTGEVAKALGVHYNTAYNLASSKIVPVPKGDNGQYDWGQEHLAQAKKIMAERAKSGRGRGRPTGTTNKAKKVSGVGVLTAQDAKVLTLLARLEGKSEAEYLHDWLAEKAKEVKSQMDSILK